MYSFGDLGFFLLSGVQTAHADGVVSDKVNSSNAEIVLSEATVSIPKESLAPTEAPSTAVTPEKTSESSQHVETDTADETHKVENTT